MRLSLGVPCCWHCADALVVVSFVFRSSLAHALPVCLVAFVAVAVAVLP